MLQTLTRTEIAELGYLYATGKLEDPAIAALVGVVSSLG